MKKFNLEEKKKIWKEESKGIGDTVAKVTKTVGIEPCQACEERRQRWNEKFAYKKKED